MNLTSGSLSKTILIWQDIDVYENVVVENGATLHFCGGRLVNKSTDGQTFFIQGDDVTIIAGTEHRGPATAACRVVARWRCN